MDLQAIFNAALSAAIEQALAPIKEQLNTLQQRYDAMAEWHDGKLQGLVEQTVSDHLDNLDLSDALDLDDAINNALENIDLSSQVEEAMDNYDLDDKVRYAVKHNLSFTVSVD
ncbi:hypothetical protein UFOVP336_13 [uncultured Caudovirales phage]|uniref:Uncharacterized protein n=1 Tax=uncultured Caudovirales phage TaxID=2100421 RepID=A0A6J5LWM5_9CAUD|nr:hypothetical protein UFOVP336_13 [uncultured Caudovirales phage]